MASSTYRDEALARLDFRAFYEQRLELRQISGEEYRFRCPFHDDDQASANVNLTTGLWNCHACVVGGSPFDFLMRKDGLTFGEALAEIGKAAGMPEPGRRVNGAANGAPRPAAAHPPGDGCLPPDTKITAWHEAALRNTDLMRWFSEHRGYTRDTITRWQLGWDGSRVTIPIRNRDGVLVNVRRYKRDSRAEKQKMIGVAQHNEAALFPEQAADTDDPLLVEGEWDMILMQQHGFANCLTVTSGAGIWKPHFTPLFAGKDVTVVYDNDNAGRQGSEKVARALYPVAASVAVVVIPGLGDKEDVTDFFVEHQRDVEELRSIIADAPAWVVKRKPTGPAIELLLGQASDAQYRGQQITMPVLVSGKLTQPYTVPLKYTAHCNMDNKNLCVVCPMKGMSGKSEVTLEPSDPKVLSLINTPDQAQEQVMKKLAQAMPNCNRPTYEIHESVNIEELRLIPELDTSSDGSDTEYVSRTGYLIGHGLRANRGYRVTGYSHPHPKSQATVHLLTEAIPAQDNIGSFAMTPEIRDQLAIYQGDPTTMAAAIYEDQRRNVHRIQGRPEMQIAFDLVWHSVIAFTFNNAFVIRGWAEALIVSDSGQAKSGMAMALLKHYRLGERVQSENATLAGLIGGLEKMGDNWILTWGKVPLNDKRLIVIDECQALRSGQIEAMSDVRATGEAELTKIRTERTNARCRIVWLANSSTGRQLSTYNQGVMALKDVFSKPEDIRRLDFVLGLASGDIDSSVINAPNPPSEAPRFSSDSCRNLILWAWSRTPSQITFTPAATTAILEHASDFAARYHSSIPIVEPADQRLKLARLSAAMAARVFSTDDGERLIVDTPHVEFVVDYLHRIYNARALSYGEYSIQQRGGETLPDPTRVWAELMTLDSADALITWLRQATVFKRQDLEDGVGYSTDVAKQVVKALTRLQLVRSNKQGFHKQPAFITLLRNPPEDAPPWEDEDDD